MTEEREQRLVAAALVLTMAAVGIYHWNDIRPPQLPEPGLRRCDELQLRAAIVDAEKCELRVTSAHRVECQAAAVAKNCDLVEQAPESMAAW